MVPFTGQYKEVSDALETDIFSLLGFWLITELLSFSGWITPLGLSDFSDFKSAADRSDMSSGSRNDR